MALAERKASVKWEGDLVKGSGVVHFASSGIGDFPVTWAARTEAPGGKTSPEELIAGAHAACFSMSLAHGLAQGGNQPDRLDVEAVCSLDRIDGKPRITSMLLSVRGKVPGIDQEGFEKAAQAARDGCPVSNALRNNVTLYVEATLE
ncbi:MAG: OsmC family peroxiredoxin [Longimicrobiales bacterium]